MRADASVCKLWVTINLMVRVSKVGSLSCIVKVVVVVHWMQLPELPLATLTFDSLITRRLGAGKMSNKLSMEVRRKFTGQILLLLASRR